MPDIIEQLSKKYGAGVIATAADSIHGEDKPGFISTGSLRLDTALGGGNKLGGIYRRRITSIWGEKSTGKTTLCNALIANVQQSGGKCLYVAFESKYDKEYAVKCGVDLAKLMFVNPVPDDKKFDILAGEQVFFLFEELLKAYEFDLVVIDSLSAMSPKREFDGEVGEFNPGLHAQVTKRMMPKMSLWATRYNTAIVLVEQAVDNWGGTTFSAKKKMSGGNAVFHASAVIIKMARGFVKNSDKVKDGDEIVGQYIHAYIEHNQVNKAFKAADVAICDNGIDRFHDLISYAGEVDCLIKKGGGNFYYVDDSGEPVKMDFNGKSGELNAVEFLRANPEVFEYVRGKVIEHIERGKGD